MKTVVGLFLKYETVTFVSEPDNMPKAGFKEPCNRFLFLLRRSLNNQFAMMGPGFRPRLPQVANPRSLAPLLMRGPRPPPGWRGPFPPPGAWRGPRPPMGVRGPRPEMQGGPFFRGPQPNMMFNMGDGNQGWGDEEADGNGGEAQVDGAEQGEANQEGDGDTQPPPPGTPAKGSVTPLMAMPAGPRPGMAGGPRPAFGPGGPRPGMPGGPMSGMPGPRMPGGVGQAMGNQAGQVQGQQMGMQGQQWGMQGQQQQQQDQQEEGGAQSEETFIDRYPNLALVGECSRGPTSNRLRTAAREACGLAARSPEV